MMERPFNKQSFDATGKTATRDEVVAAARSYVGTPYRDHGRGRAVDCIGLPVMVAHKLEIMKGNYLGYTPTPKGTHAMDVADLHLKRVWSSKGWPEIRRALVQPVAEARPGSIGLFWYSNPKEPQHFAFFANHPNIPSVCTMIHAHSRIGACVEESMSDFWWKRLLVVYDYHMIEGGDD